MAIANENEKEVLGEAEGTVSEEQNLNAGEQEDVAGTENTSEETGVLD